MQLQTRNLINNIGTREDQELEIAEGLFRLLANTYTLYFKTHSFYWNITGSSSPVLQGLFEEHYTELAHTIDDIAKRIRSLGFPVPSTYSEFARLSAVPETAGVPSAEEMVALLLDDNKTVMRAARALVPTAKQAGDELTVRLLTERVHWHDRTIWMLRSLLN